MSTGKFVLAEKNSRARHFAAALLVGTSLASLATGSAFAAAVNGDAPLAANTPITIAGGDVLTSSANHTYSNVIDGAGGLDVLGNQLTLTGANLYTGGTTISSGGTLWIGNGGTTGSILGNVVDNGALKFAHSDNVTFAGNISGSGFVGQFGSGTLTLSGTNTYTGSTVINTGALFIASQSNIGTGGILLENNGVLRVTSSANITSGMNLALGGGTIDTGANTVTWTGGIGGNGTLTKAGTGTLVITNTTSYDNGTTISAGTLQIGNGGTTGSITGDVANNGVLAFKRSDVVSFSGDISGGGILEQDGAGTLVLTGNNTYTGGTNITAGTLQIGNGGTTGSITGNVSDDGVLAFDRTDTVIFAGNITGSGSLTQAGTGILALTGTNTYTGGTTISAGTLLIGSGGTSGSIQGNVVDNGLLNFFRSDAVTFAGDVSGTGVLRQSGSGTLTLTGNNTNMGGVVVAAGTLVVGDGATSGSIAGDVVDNSHLVVDRSDTITLNGVISGTGTLEQAGTGTLVLTGTNTYTGGTTISAGTLQIGNGGTTGSITGNVVNDGLLAFNRSDVVGYSGDISGSGILEQDGTGTLVLTGNNTYTGGTNILAGAIIVGNGGTTGSITGGVFDDGVLAFDRTDTVTFDGDITGSGSLTQGGTGTLILTGGNLYTGGTTISQGELQIGNGGLSGSIVGDVAMSNGMLTVNRAGLFTMAGVISGTGNLIKKGSGTLVLTGANTYSRGTTISDGALQIGNGGTTGSIVGDVVDNGTLRFNRSNAMTFAGVISGTGAVEQNGGGIVTLTGANTYSGGTTINNTVLQVGDGGTTGTIVGDVTMNNASLWFNRSNAVTFAGNITGAGAVVQTGPGTTTLTGANTYSLGTTITNGTLAVSNQSNLGTGNIAINNGATLRVNTSTSFSLGVLLNGVGGTIDTGANAVSWTGDITGLGPLTKNGSGTLTLPVTEDYTGATTVSGGTLLVTGSIAHSSGVTVSSGGTLGGTGTVSATTIAGKVAPGVAGVGTLNVNGDLSLGSTASYVFDTTSATHDMLNVTGNATLGGTLNVSATGSGFTVGQVIPILMATGARTGTFSSIAIASEFNGGALLPVLGYDATSAFLTLKQAAITPLLPSDISANEHAVAHAVDIAIVVDGGSAVINSLASLPTASLEATLGQMSGEGAVATQNTVVSTMNSFLGGLLDVSLGGLNDGAEMMADNGAGTQLAFNGPASDAPLEHDERRGFSVWSNVQAERDHTGGDDILGSHASTLTAFGGQIGVDYRGEGRNDTLGAALGVGEQNWKLHGDLGKGHASSYQAGLYYSRNFADSYLAAAFSYAGHRVTTERVVNFNGVNSYGAEFYATSKGMQVEGGHSFALKFGRLTPFVRVQAQETNTPDYAEATLSGSSDFALSYDRQKHYDYRTELGADWNRGFVFKEGSLTDLHVRLGWQHNFSDGLLANARFTAFDGTSFAVNGTSPVKNAAHVALGVEHQVSKLVFKLGSDEAFSGNSLSYGGNASISYRW